MNTQVNDRRGGIVDICLSLFLFVVCGMTLYEAGKLPDPDYEPLGPAFLPVWLAWMIIILAAVVLIRGIKVTAAGQKSEKPSSPFITPLALFSILFSFLYVAVMYFELIGYKLASIFYITILGYSLTHFKIKGLIISLIIALIATLGSHYIFTKVLVIALP